MKKWFTVLSMLFATQAVADWHHGKLGIIAFGYDGKTISVGQEGFERTDCTCYPTWPGRYCLDASRETYEKEYAFLLMAKSQDKAVNINIDEASCKIRAIYAD